MQRTIADAQDTFDALAGLSPADQKAFKAELDTAVREARAVAGRMAQGRVDDVAAVRDDALAELCAARDDFQALKRDADLGRVSARDYESRLRVIQARQRRADRHLADVTDAIALVEAIEEDPVAYAEGLYAKFPSIRPDFSF